ncbi:patatin-like phospholipase family protein [Methylobacterium sp. NMS12]|uniref:patatin-like phospholipase family protein n=1 Tax=Methylobacterium sp. NMS12 TaxID=3079766 RepID=UPI003F880A22
MRAFGVFEGGGVRGYAHLGALKACEDRGIRFDGVSGTSIGAIVAALVAAGYTSTELYEADDRDRERGLFAIDVEAEFLDPVENARLKRLRLWRDRGSGFSKWGRGHIARARQRIPGGLWLGP